MNKPAAKENMGHCEELRGHMFDCGQPKIAGPSLVPFEIQIIMPALFLSCRHDFLARARGLINNNIDRYFVHTGTWMGTYVRAARPG